jgi:hypothetical protein
MRCDTSKAYKRFMQFGKIERFRISISHPILKPNGSGHRGDTYFRRCRQNPEWSLSSEIDSFSASTARLTKPGKNEPLAWPKVQTRALGRVRKGHAY